MSVVLQHAKDSIDAMNIQERLDILEYLASRLKVYEEKNRVGQIFVTVSPDLATAPSAIQLLTEMRDARDNIRSITDDPETNWKRLKELGCEMDSQPGNEKSLMEILTEMRG